MSKTITLEVGGNGIATMTIDVKERPMNLLTPEFLDDLAATVETVAANDAIKGVVMLSGKDSFLAGADLMSIVHSYDRQDSIEKYYQDSVVYSRILRRMETCGKPYAVVINGTALGGGLELCLGCHYRVVENNPKSVLGLPEVNVGLLPGAGGTQRLPRLIGIEKSAPLLLKGTHLSPSAAVEMGIGHELVAPGEGVAAATKWLLESATAVQPWDVKGFTVPGGAGASTQQLRNFFSVGTALLAKETKHNYPAPIAIMSCLYEGPIVPMDKALEIEVKYFATLLANPVARNLTRTLFINKGKADKLVARPKGVEAKQFKKVAVLGAGMMGAGIAFVSARAGMEVVLLDTDMANAEKGKDYSRGLMQKRLDRGQTSQDKMDALLALITPTTDFADLAGCDLVIEAVFENREIKADVTRKAEAVIGSDAIFASNTSTLPISGLAEASVRPESFIGLHFFSPVDKMALLEVIVGEKTSQQCLANALDYVKQIRKTPIVVNDHRGFYTSRVFGTFCDEGLAMLSEGVAPALIENCAVQAGMPVGPLAVVDEVTIELQYKVNMQNAADIGEAYEMPHAWPVWVNFHENLKRLGKRYGAGFYDYPEGAKKRLWPGLAEQYPPAAEQPTPEEVKTRILYRQAIESVRCLEEGVMNTPEDADIGSILGWGFPAYTGGTVSFIETVGIKQFVAEADRLAATYGKRFAVPEGLRKMAESGGRFYPLENNDSEASAA